MPDPARIVVWSDVACPWAHLAVYRLLVARDRLGLTGAVVLEHRPFPLELVNSRPTSYAGLAAEIPVLAGLEPTAGWRRWRAPLWEWPVTTLPAMEAVQAVAAGQGLAAAERLDRALRSAFFAESRCVSLRSVVLAVAGDCDGVDADLVADALDTGRARAAVMAAWREGTATGVPGSPFVVLPDGTGVFNPGVRMRWLEAPASGYPVVDADDRTVYDDLVSRAGKPAAPG